MDSCRGGSPPNQVPVEVSAPLEGRSWHVLDELMIPQQFTGFQGATANEASTPWTPLKLSQDALYIYIYICVYGTVFSDPQPYNGANVTVNTPTQSRSNERATQALTPAFRPHVSPEVALLIVGLVPDAICAHQAY